MSPVELKQAKLYRVDYTGEAAKIVVMLLDTPICKGMPMSAGFTHGGERYGFLGIDSFDRAARLLAAGETLTSFGFRTQDAQRFREDMRKALEHFDIQDGLQPPPPSQT